MIFGGGGSSRADYLLVFDGPLNDPPTKPKKIRCTDSDSRCDADGTVNGMRTFPVGVCANRTFDHTRCTLNGVDSVAVEHASEARWRAASTASTPTSSISTRTRTRPTSKGAASTAHRSTDFRDVYGTVLKHFANMTQTDILASVLKLDGGDPTRYWTTANFDLGFLP